MTGRGKFEVTLEQIEGRVSFFGNLTWPDQERSVERLRPKYLRVDYKGNTELDRAAVSC